MQRTYTAKQKQEFEDIFSVPLSSFWSRCLGFDVVKFDDEVIKSHYSPMDHRIRVQYGEYALNLVRDLTKITPTL